MLLRKGPRVSDKRRPWMYYIESPVFVALMIALVTFAFAGFEVWMMNHVEVP